MHEPDLITDKIKKLLRLAKSDNEHEAMQAMASAAKLAAKHSIDLADLAEGEERPPEHIIHQWFPCGLRHSREWMLALGVVQNYFHVKACLARGKFVLVGRSEDIQIANSILTYLLKASRAGVARFAEDEADHRRRMTTNKRASYLNAFFAAINSKLSSQMQQMKLEHTRLAIVLHNNEAARDEAMDDVVPDRVQKAGPRSPKRRDLNANLAGWLDGRSTTVMPEIKPPVLAQGMLALPE